ncbi:MAG: hypothetical protein HYX96_04535 [Chloroflexi bacterium]|nr:hypothetical protein [Chloroflexota bacterium]
MRIQHRLSGIGRIGVLVFLGALIVLALVRMSAAYIDIGTTGDFDGARLTSYDFSAVPESVREDADALAAGLFGTGDKYRAFVDQLLASYLDTRDKDFIVLFNPGGWGTSTINETPGWLTIIDAIKSELDSSGRTSVVLTYQRTGSSLLARFKELTEILNHYPSKAADLAGRVAFLTRNNPALTVIVAGESSGTVFSDYTLEKLGKNEQVYSIQTGVPYWHRPLVREQTLRINSNGVRPDSLSQGNIPLMLWATVKSVLGFDDDAQGRVFRYLKAPGHDYSWQYQEISDQIIQFLKTSFNIIVGEAPVD